MIHFLLFYRIEWCERHPRLMLALLFVLICLGGAIDPATPL